MTEHQKKNYVLVLSDEPLDIATHVRARSLEEVFELIRTDDDFCYTYWNAFISDESLAIFEADPEEPGNYADWKLVFCTG